ncbi:MAG: amidohydrolase family protein [Dehalococcoidia bacterium]
MIVDLHTHVFSEPGVVPGWFWDKIKEAIAGRSGKSLEEVEREVFANYWDPDGETIVREMDAAGVSKAVVVCLDWGLAGLKGEADYPPERLNEIYRDIVRKHPDRLLFGCGVDPRRPNAIEIIEQGVREFGARLVKVYPPAGWYPNDRAHYPFFEKCVELGVPVLMHTGPSVAHLLSKYADVAWIEELAADLPELKIVCAHSGFGLWPQFAAIAEFKRNLYLELGAWYSQAANHPKKYYAAVREMMDRAPGRVLFSSDYSGFPGTLGPYVEAVREMKERAAGFGIEFSDDEVAAFTGGTASQLIGLAG